MTTGTETLKETGNKFFHNHEYSKAIEMYTEGLKQDPTNIALNCNLAQAYLAVGNYLQAEVHAVVTLAHQENSVKGYYRAAKAALGDGKRERALHYLRRGLVHCPKAEELNTLYTHINESNDGDSTPSENKLVQDNTKTTTENNGHMVRSPHNIKEKVVRSSSGEPKDSRVIGSSSKMGISTPPPVFINRRAYSEGDDKAKEDPFIQTLLKLKDELPAEEKSPQLREREILQEKRKDLRMYMREGSEAIEKDSALKATEMYKSALDIMATYNIELFGLREIDCIILKYSLSLSWIKTLTYNNIVQSINYLSEMEKEYASELPAVYYGLSQAFYQLNRFKAALGHLQKGSHVLENDMQIIAYPWPGTLSIIPETTKDGLRESIEKMTIQCKIYREPDAVCRYKPCLSVSTHICPSEVIYKSDPDYIGYVVNICQENCKITYHVGCWKNYKEKKSDIGKLSDKDMLGEYCVTEDCKTSDNTPSIIIRIVVYGEDGNIKSQCSKEQVKATVIPKKDKRKKKVEKTSVTKVKQVRNTPRAAAVPEKKPEKKAKENKGETIHNDYESSLQQLNELRESNFCDDESSYWDPSRNYFGRNDVATLKTFTNQYTNDSPILKAKKDMIFKSYFDFLRTNGPQTIISLEKKWEAEATTYPGVNEFLSVYDNICEFLLNSYWFANIGKYLCLSYQISDTYKMVQNDIEKSDALAHNHSSTDDQLTTDQMVKSEITNHNIPEDSNDTTSCNHASLDNMDTKTCSCSESDEEDTDDEVEKEEEEDLYKCCKIVTSDKSTDYEDEMQSINTEGNEEIIDNIEEPCKLVSETHTPVVNDIDGEKALSYAREVCQGVNDETIENKKDSDKILIVSKETVDTLSQTYDPEYDNLSVNNLTAQLKDYKEENMHLREEVESQNKELQELLEINKKKIADITTQKNEEIQKLCKENLSNYETLQAEREMYEQRIKQLSENVEKWKNVKTDMQMNEHIEKQNFSIKSLEKKLKLCSQEVLNTKKAFGQYKLNSYLEKCDERLKTMNSVLKDLSAHSVPTVTEMGNAICAWEKFEKKLKDLEKLLQVQYEILSLQIQKSDTAFQWELEDIPPEPSYPLKDYITSIGAETQFLHYSLNAAPGTNMSLSNQNYKEKIVRSYSNEHLTSKKLSVHPNDHVCGFQSQEKKSYYKSLESLPISFTECKQPVLKLLNKKSRETKEHVEQANKWKEFGSSSSISIPMDRNIPLLPTPYMQITSQGFSRSIFFETPLPSASYGHKRCDYSTLMGKLQPIFKGISEDELSECVVIVRERNKNKLSGLAASTILHQIEIVLQEKSSKRISTLGIDKFGVAAWQKVKSKTINWHSEDFEECVICQDTFIGKRTYLQCKHIFHTQCIQKWLRKNSVCPVCRMYTRLELEFPPLA